MTLAIVITALAVFLCGVSIGILAVLVAGIRSDDHAQNLTGNPRTRTEAVTRRLLHPERDPQQPQPGPAPGQDLSPLAAWVAAQPEGNRNNGLYWAANRALEADPAADLSPLSTAARQAGLDDLEITRTLNSARRNPHPQAEAT